MNTSSFSDLGLSAPLLQALADVGYESPSPIQAATIPLMMSGRDVLGQAQTGTGKTAAFALPILARIDLAASSPQSLVLAPTRELAIQVAEAFQRYATHLPGFHVLPIYGGQSYHPQLSALRRGVHVIVGTPGRVIDHLDKGSLDLSRLRTLVLDEADEMLRMGFVEEVERILKETPRERQTALFSATMPPPIRRIARAHMREPAEVTVAARTATAENIRQRYWLVSGMHKLDALTRILEVEPFDAMIVFSRTKLGTEELAERLQARGFSAVAINGDMIQQQRERTVAQLREGAIDILVATDVAARGLDVERVSHVVNYDVPTDPESYTHRIGRTGRAGRSGEAILFVTPRERGLLRAIERSTRQPIEPLELPTIRMVNTARIARFKERITETLDAGGLDVFATIVSDYERETGVPVVEIAAALARMSRGGTPLLLAKGQEGTLPPSGADAGRGPGDATPAARDTAERVRAGRPAAPAPREFEPRMPPPAHHEHAPAGPREERAPARSREARPGASSHDARSPAPSASERPRAARPGIERPLQAGVTAYRVEVGAVHGVKPGNLVGAICNESGLDAKLIGRIEIFDTWSAIEMPGGMPRQVMKHLQGVRVGGQPLKIRDVGEMPAPPRKPRKKPAN